VEDSGKPGKDWTRALREAAPYLGIGTSLAVTVGLGVGIGYWLDKRFGTEPVFFLVGAGLGLVAAGVQFYRLVAVRKR
jgi:ATP synthase protein I